MDKNNQTKKRGIFGRLCKAMYKNYMYGHRDNRDYAAMYRNGDLEAEDIVDLAARNAYLNSPEYKQQQMLEQMAANQEALAERIISQGMTWLVPRFEQKLDEISQKIKKD